MSEVNAFCVAYIHLFPAMETEKGNNNIEKKTNEERMEN